MTQEPIFTCPACKRKFGLKAWYYHTVSLKKIPGGYACRTTRNKKRSKADADHRTEIAHQD